MFTGKAFNRNIKNTTAMTTLLKWISKYYLTAYSKSSAIPVYSDAYAMYRGQRNETWLKTQLYFINTRRNL